MMQCIDDHLCMIDGIFTALLFRSLRLEEASNSVSYTCKCPSAFIGSYCQYAKCPCEHGQCVSETVVEITDHRCLCQPNYTGRNCQTLMKPCESNPCLGKNTVCSDVEGEWENDRYTLEYQCQCDQKMGFTGKLCDVEMNPCLSLPCDDGYLCKSKRFSMEYECVCDALFCSALFWVSLVLRAVGFDSWTLDFELLDVGLMDF